MCFSTEASFTASAVLLIAGVVSIKKVTAPSQLVFASIPIVFSIQQFLEGILWLALTHADYAQLHTPATYVFLFFAQVLWPAWVPLSFLLLEKEITRKKILFVLFGIGALLSVYLAYCLFYYEVNSKLSEHHIRYELLFPSYLGWLVRLFYFMPIAFSPFVSSIKKAWMIGVLIVASYLVSVFFFQDALISVWCFLAAIISVVVLAVIGSLQKTHAAAKNAMTDP